MNRLRIAFLTLSAIVIAMIVIWHSPKMQARAHLNALQWADRMMDVQVFGKKPSFTEFLMSVVTRRRSLAEWQAFNASHDAALFHLGYLVQEDIRWNRFDDEIIALLVGKARAWFPGEICGFQTNPPNRLTIITTPQLMPQAKKLVSQVQGLK